MKRLIAIAGAGAMFLATATPAFAGDHRWFRMGGDYANVTNTAVATANTGDNDQDNWGKGDNIMFTGDAYAGATAVTIANTHVSDCGCRDLGLWFHKDRANVTNTAVATANTGDNDQDIFGSRTRHHSRGGGDNYLETGMAGAEADAWTVVNTHITGFGYMLLPE